MNLNAGIERFKQQLDSTFVRNLGWLGISKIIIRSTRILATIALARYLTQYEFGVAALVLTTYEFMQIFTRFGIGAKLIQADEKDVDELAQGAYWLNWVLYAALFVVQCAVAFPAAWIYREQVIHVNHLILPICVMGAVYLVSPFGRIQGTLIERENRLKISALANAAQLSVANILTAILAISGLGLWAIVLPKLLSSPVSVFIFLRCHPWRPGGFTTKRWREIFRFGWNILLVGLLGTLRDNMDYLIVGQVLGVRALGIYYFAFNSGLGISLEIIQAVSTALYPHLCAARAEWLKFKQRYFQSFKAVGVIIIPLVILQAGLAPFYVPLVFGAKWQVAVPILMIICISAIPRAFSIVASFLLNAVDKPHIALKWNVVFTLLFAIGLVAGVHWDVTSTLEAIAARMGMNWTIEINDEYGYLLGVAISVLVAHIIFVPIYITWVTQYVFGKEKTVLKPGG